MGEAPGDPGRPWARVGGRLGRRLVAHDHRPRPCASGSLFERFLNPERVSMPDFRHRFLPGPARRGDPLRPQKYGRDRVAQIITFGKLQAAPVLRDVGRVLGMPYGQVDRLCKLVPNNPAHPVSLERRYQASRNCSRRATATRPSRAS